MSKNRHVNKSLARIALVSGAVAVLSAGGLVLVTQAQEKPADATPAQPVAYTQLKADAVTGGDAAFQVSTSAAYRPAKTLPFRGDTIKGKPIMLRKPQAPARVQWSQAMQQAGKMKTQRQTQGLAATLDRKALDRTRLPVILPRAGGMIQTARSRMMSFGDAYALNMPQDKGVQLTMYGNRTFVPTDSGAISQLPMQRLAGMAEDIRISQMEDGWTATFTRYGVVYSLDVSCDDINSPDCQSDAYIRNAIAQFDDVAMGADAEAEAKSEGVTAPDSGNWLDQISNTITKLTKGG